jgi:3-deoxy-manno-octulosonate cytidylyltransferase (CMP-KDO synthetase)
MRIYGLIPARYASTRLPGKPLAMICGKPMIRHVFERAALCRYLSKVVVATEDSRIFDTVQSFGGNCVLTGAHHPSGTDRLAEAVDILGLAQDDIIVNIQGDEPLLDPAMIEVLVEAILSQPPCEMATLAYSSSSEQEFVDPNVVKVVVDRNAEALYFSRAPIPFHRGEPVRSFLKHLGFYAYSRRSLARFAALPEGKLEKIEKLEQLRALENGFSIRVALSPVDSVAVDTPGDLSKTAELMSARQRASSSESL